MMKRYLMILVLAAMLMPAALLVPAGRAAAQPEPTIELLPSSGPCDAVVDMRGTGFELPADPTQFLRLYLLRPGTEDVAMRALRGGLVQPDGTFAARVGPGVARCDVAALDSEAEQPSGYIVIAVTASPKSVEQGQRIPGIIATARYEYTTTAPPPEPVMALSRAGGPCDAPLEVSGRGFGPPAGSPKDIALYILQPGTEDVSMAVLNPARVDGDGAFSQWVPRMWEHGCKAAALDRQAEEPSGHVIIAATTWAEPASPGERVPDIAATAAYAYTTTARRVPTEALSIVPPSEPCDGTVNVTGSGFEPGMEAVLKLASPSGEFGMGTLASAVADEAGEFEVHFSFGELGCRAAELITEYGMGGELVLGAFPATYPMPRPPGPPASLAVVRYTFTTASPGGAAPPQALPDTGTGLGAAAGPPGWLVLIGSLAGLGLALLMASLYLRRKRT